MTALSLHVIIVTKGKFVSIRNFPIVRSVFFIFQVLQWFKLSVKWRWAWTLMVIQCLKIKHVSRRLCSYSGSLQRLGIYWSYVRHVEFTFHTKVPQGRHFIILTLYTAFVLTIMHISMENEQIIHNIFSVILHVLHMHKAVMFFRSTWVRKVFRYVKLWGLTFRSWKSDYEVCHSASLQIYFHHLAFLTANPKHGRRAFVYMKYLGMWLPWLGIEPTASC